MNLRILLCSAAIAAFGGTLGAPAMGQRLPEPGTSGQPLASGQISGEDVHGAVHCQAVARAFLDPGLSPGAAPGSVVITPNGPVLGAPRDGVCAQIYELFAGQQP